MKINFPKRETITYDDLENTVGTYAYLLDEYKPMFNGALLTNGEVVISPEKLLEIAPALFDQTGTIETYETAGNQKAIVFKNDDSDIEFYPFTAGDVLERIESGNALGWANDTDAVYQLIANKVSVTLVHANKSELEDHGNRAFVFGNSYAVAEIEI